MPREISSSVYTAFTKLGTIIFFGLLAPLIIIFSFESIGKFLLQVLFLLPLSFLMIRWALKFKQVEINESGLLISEVNFSKKEAIFVPFEKIKGIKQSFFQHLNPETITIEFIEPTTFGKKIKFIPEVRFFSFLAHPVVEKLNRLIWMNK